MISFLLGKIKNKQLKEDIACCLAVGLAWGLALGLAVGLAWGLAVGLACCLACGLAVGLAVGLAWGLAVGLAWGLAVGLAVGLAWPWYVTFVLTIFFGEYFFLNDGSKPNKKQSVWWFTFWHKLEALIESLIIVVNVSNLFKLSQEVDLMQLWENNKNIIFQILGWSGIATIIALVFIGYIWINSKRYKR